MPVNSHTSPDKKRNGITSRRLFASLGLVLAGFLASGLPVRAQTSPPPAMLTVVASFSILADIARQVGGDRIEVTSLVRTNGDAHVYRPTPQDVRSVKAADVVIVNGLGFEGFIPRLIKSSGTNARLITATRGLSPLGKDRKSGHAHGHEHGARVDPHAWQSIEAVKLYVDNIADGLAAADDSGAVVYRANAGTYRAALDALKSELDAAFAAIPEDRRIIITSHDSFGYFARDFKFRMEAVQGVSTETEPSAQDIARIIRLAKATKARAVFIENMTDPRIGERLARETGARLGGTLFSDALSDEKGPAPTYIAMMRHNARMLVDALKD